MKLIKSFGIILGLTLFILLLLFSGVMLTRNYKINKAQMLDAKQALVLYEALRVYKQQTGDKIRMVLYPQHPEFAQLPKSIRDLNPVSVAFSENNIIISRYDCFVESSGIYISLNGERPDECMNPHEIIRHVYSYFNPG